MLLNEDLWQGGGSVASARGLQTVNPEAVSSGLDCNVKKSTKMAIWECDRAETLVNAKEDHSSKSSPWHQRLT